MKMEGIELYPHNQKAYDNLCAMLRDNNRACVVQPTGTGKFVIIAKMAQDNPGKNFLLLGTNDYMYIDQMANLSDIAPGFTPKNTVKRKQPPRERRVLLIESSALRRVRDTKPMSMREGT